MPTLTLPANGKSPAFLRAISFILPHETDYIRGHWGDDSSESFVHTENVSGDSGGATRYGIDSSSHPGVNVAELTRDEAIDIYWSEWIAHRLDLLPERLAIAAFDVYVNGGYPITWLQHAYNSSHLDIKPLSEDNQLGTLTLKALSSANQDAILRIFLRLRNERFKTLAQRPSLAKFLPGWLQRDTDLSTFLNVYYPPGHDI